MTVKHIGSVWMTPNLSDGALAVADDGSVSIPCMSAFLGTAASSATVCASFGASRCTSAGHAGRTGSVPRPMLTRVLGWRCAASRAGVRALRGWDVWKRRLPRYNRDTTEMQVRCRVGRVEEAPVGTGRDPQGLWVSHRRAGWEHVGIGARGSRCQARTVCARQAVAAGRRKSSPRRPAPRTARQLEWGTVVMDALGSVGTAREVALPPTREPATPIQPMRRPLGPPSLSRLASALPVKAKRGVCSSSSGNATCVGVGGLGSGSGSGSRPGLGLGFSRARVVRGAWVLLSGGSRP